MRSISSARAVSMMTGSPGPARRSRHSESPLSPGSMTSSTTMSGRACSSARRISRPSVASETRKPLRCRYSPSSLRISASSSTTSTWSGRSIAGSIFAAATGASSHVTQCDKGARLQFCRYTPPL